MPEKAEGDSSPHAMQWPPAREHCAAGAAGLSFASDMSSQTKSAPWWTIASDWAQRNPLAAFLTAAVAAILIYFFGFVPLFTNGGLSTWVWAWQAWNPETNYEHAKLIPLIVAFLVWHSSGKLKAARVSSSPLGWVFIGFGLLLFIGGARTLQARLALTAIPFLLYGIVLYVWGKEVARVLLFPIAFLLFMVPLNFLTQATARLQFLETNTATAVCNFFGMGLYSIGTAVHSPHFNFEVDEGCSGIRSLMAIAMLSAIYGHLTQDRLWKKIAIFFASLVFAIVGNAGRLVSIFMVAALFGQDIAGGPYHNISGFLSFPFAIAAMVLFGKLLNIKPRELKAAPPAKEHVQYDY
ncbi:MAG: exosortase/archaeosortase family protein [Verrucomicrobiota bacterium]|nr:exosortase/archaeosortase family protein [Verrucomicrobiota bacterium]